MCCLSFDKINFIIARCDDFYGRYCIQKSKNGHFHPQFANIAFHIKSYSFSVVKNKQTRPGFLVLENFITCWPPEKPRNISPWTRAKMAGIVSKVYYFSTGLTHNSNILVACEQALCLGKKSLFPLPSSPLDQRPVHRLISSWHSCFKISHSEHFECVVTVVVVYLVSRWVCFFGALSCGWNWKC